jgi:hypothetical protein
MILRVAKTFAGVLFFVLITGATGHAACPINTIIVKGRVEHAPGNAKVRVQLLYPNKLTGDSGETTVEEGRFTIPIEFLTQSRRPVLVGSLREKCDRKPEIVAVTLLGGEPPQEYDRVSLDLAKDFKKADPTAYTLQSEIVLDGRP